MCSPNAFSVYRPNSLVTGTDFDELGSFKSSTAKQQRVAFVIVRLLNDRLRRRFRTYTVFGACAKHNAGDCEDDFFHCVSPCCLHY